MSSIPPYQNLPTVKSMFDQNGTKEPSRTLQTLAKRNLMELFDLSLANKEDPDKVLGSSRRKMPKIASSSDEEEILGSSIDSQDSPTENPEFEGFSSDSEGANDLQPPNTSENSSEIYSSFTPTVNFDNKLIPLPTPNFQDMNLNLVGRFVPKAPQPQKALDEKAKNFLTSFKGLQSGTLTYNGQAFQVHPIEGAKGEFMQAYEVIDTNALVSGIKNKNLIIKAFHKDRIERSPAKLKKLMESSIAQYRLLLERKIRVARIYNAPSDNLLRPIQDLFYISERIPTEINPELWPSNLPIEQLSQEIQEILKQVKKLFNFSLKENVLLDLLPSNVRLDHDKQVVITDFQEEEFESDEFLSEFHKQITMWSKRNPNIYNYLTSKFEIINPNAAEMLNNIQSHSQ